MRSIARPAGDHRERGRRRRHDRRRPRRSARRPTATRSPSANGRRMSSPARCIRCHTMYLKDFEPVSLLSIAPLWIIARKDLPAKDLTRADRLAQGQSGQGDGRHHRPRQRGRICAVVYFQNRPAPASSSCPIAAPRRLMQDLRRRPDRPRSVPRRRNAVAISRRQHQGLRGADARSAGSRRPTCRPSTRRACPGFTCRSGTACGCPRARRRTSSPSSTRAVVDALADPAVRQRLTELGQEICAARAADAGGARRLPQGRDREVVADHQGGQHQGWSEGE